MNTLSVAEITESGRCIPFNPAIIRQEQENQFLINTSLSDTCLNEELKPYTHDRVMAWQGKPVESILQTAHMWVHGGSCAVPRQITCSNTSLRGKHPFPSHPMLSPVGLIFLNTRRISLGFVRKESFSLPDLSLKVITRGRLASPLIPWWFSMVSLCWASVNWVDDGN